MEVEAATKLLFKEEVDIMEDVEEEEDGAAALQTRKKLHHDHEEGTNGDLEVEEEEDGAVALQTRKKLHHEHEEGTNGDLEVEEEEEEHKSVFFDPAKGLWRCRHCDWTYHLSSPSVNGTLTNGRYRHQIEWNLESLESYYGSPNKVPDHVAEVSARYLVSAAMQFVAQKEDTNETLSPKGKDLEAQGNVNAQEINYIPSSNGKLENGSHPNGSHELSNGSETKISYVLTIDKTNNLRTSDDSMGTTNGDETEVDKDKKHVTEDKLNIQEYDLEKIIDEQETHDLYCPNCNSCITRRVILRKRKRTARPTTHAGPAKEPRITDPSPSDPTPTIPEGPEDETPDVFRCLSCFYFFIPEGCDFNIFRIFRRREVYQEVQGQQPSASPEMPHSENCGSWLLSCFEPGDGPRKTDAGPANVPTLSNAQVSNSASTSYVHGGHGTFAQPMALKGPLPDDLSYQLVKTTTTTTSSVDGHGTTVEPAELKEPLPNESSCQLQTTTTTNTTTASLFISSPTGSTQSEETKLVTKSQVIEHNNQICPLKPTTDATHLPGKKVDQQTSRKISQNGSFTSQAIHPSDDSSSPDHQIIICPVITDPPAPTSEQRDDWDILKAIVYGGLVESITSLSVVSAAAASGAKTLDIFILGIANLIGGIPLIFHNINDLRNVRDWSENDERVGHYWLQLGRRSKFQLHMVLVLLSYIIFGLLPPVIYGLSFRESNNRENKMMAVAAASLFCIALLAIGKAHVKSLRTHMKTLTYYLTIAVSASGLSYVAGVLISKLLVHFGLIDQGASPAPPALYSPYEVGAGTSAWTSI